MTHNVFGGTLSLTQSFNPIPSFWSQYHHSHKIMLCTSLYRVKQFHFNNQLFALNHVTDASLICIRALSTSESEFTLLI